MHRPIPALIVLVCATVAVAQNPKHLPLPAKVMQAKTVFIENHSGFSNIGDKAYQEIGKWGRFQVVDELSKADLVFVFTAKSIVTGSTTTGGDVQGNVDEYGGVKMKSSPRVTRENTAGFTYLTVLDSQSSDPLWNDSRAWGGLLNGFHSASSGLVKSLRKRIDEQEQPRQK